MDKYFKDAYKGDPGVPHSGKQVFEDIWIASLGFTTFIWNFPYFWHVTTPAWNWHDKAFLYEQYHWKKAKEQGKPYEFMWNKYDRHFRRFYYYNEPHYFP